MTKVVPYFSRLVTINMTVLPPPVVITDKQSLLFITISIVSFWPGLKASYPKTVCSTSSSVFSEN